MSLPGPGPNGGILIRSAPAGPIVEVGAASQQGNPAFGVIIESQAAPSPAAAPLAETIVLTNVPAGARFLVQAVLRIDSAAVNDLAASLAWDGDGNPFDAFWDQGLVTWDFSEGATQLYPMQYETEPSFGGTVTFGIIAACGGAATLSGHLSVQQLS